MAIVEPTFKSYICNVCGHVSEGGQLLSFSTFSPPPSEYTYDGSCLKCGSQDTKEDVSDDFLPF